MLALEIASPFILAIGLIGNVLSFSVFRSEQMKNLPTFKFLAYLSLIDCLHIATGMPHIMLITYGSYDFRNSSNFVCSFHSFLTIYLSHLSSNVLAAVSVFRCTELTSIKAAFKSNTNQKRNIQSKKDKNIVYSSNEMKFYQRFINNFENIEIIMLTIMFIIFIFDSHYFFFMRLTSEYHRNSTENQTIDYVCYPSLDTNAYYFYFYTVIWPWIDLLLYSYIPFLVMITSTIVIIYKLLIANRNLKKSYNSIKTAYLRKNANGLKTLSKDAAENKFVFKAAKRRVKRNNQVYRLLISLNTLFFILVTPIVTFNSITFDKKDEVILQFFYVLAYLNHCVNFVFYGLTCELFKKVLVKKFERYFNFSNHIVVVKNL